MGGSRYQVVPKLGEVPFSRPRCYTLPAVCSNTPGIPAVYHNTPSAEAGPPLADQTRCVFHGDYDHPGGHLAAHTASLSSTTASGYFLQQW